MTMNIKPHQMDRMFEAYIACALWSTTNQDDDCEYLDDNHDISDVDVATLESMREEFEEFIEEANRRVLIEDLMESDYAHDRIEFWTQIGHDFWLTRAGHGAGFWDRGIGELGDKLTELSNEYKNIDLYVGDDGKIYK